MGRGRKWTPEEISTLKECRRQNMPFKEIGELLGRPTSGVSDKFYQLQPGSIARANLDARLNAQRKPKPVLNRKRRKCLVCESDFTSEGSHNRLCPLCSDQTTELAPGGGEYGVAI